NHQPIALDKTPFKKGEARFSPDGQWVAYESSESTSTELYVASFPAFDNRRQLTAHGGIAPRWRSDGKELFYLTPDGKLMAADVTGSISGTVKDNTDAVVPNVAVIATNQATGVKSTTRTNDIGVYAFLALPVGKYQVEVRQPGFKDLRQTNIELNANSALRIDVTLQMGAVSETVEVSAATVHVETISTQMGDVIDAAKMTSQPLNGRSYIDLLGLQP